MQIRRCSNFSNAETTITANHLKQQNNIEPRNQSKDWVMYVNPSNGWPYYYNQKQHYSTYEKPTVEGKISHGIMGGGSDVGEWVEHWDEEIEAFYYYNSISGEASWVNPDLL